MTGRVFIAITLTIVLFSGCKKYPEDDVRYRFKSAKARLIGTWHLTAYYMNGGDSMNYIVSQSSCGYPYCTPSFIDVRQALTITVVEDSKLKRAHFHHSWGNSKGDMEFREHKNELWSNTITFGQSYQRSPFSVPTWKILKLTNVRMHLEKEEYGTKYRMEFVKN